jgi:selenide,water dikinase
LRPIQGIFAAEDYPNLLVGLGEGDDAAVWKLDENRAIVATTDFFTPVVDDPYDYGAISAANSLSDVYAMGGTPFLALNIAALPPELPVEINAAILHGGADKVKEAGAVLAGGHTVQDKEPKYGLIVIGFADPHNMITKSGACPGDVLVLSKPIGFGTTTTALKQSKADSEDVKEVISWMKQLNKTASLLATEFNIRGGTDVTGFSLLGHACEMAEYSNVKLRFQFHKIPQLRNARKFAEDWIFPGGSFDNRLYFSEHVVFASTIDEPNQMLLFDAQTSGGLLLSIPNDKIDAFMQRAEAEGQPMWIVGEVLEGIGIEVIE